MRGQMLMNRLVAISVLLSAYLDYFPWPETWTGAMTRRGVERGPAPWKRVPCQPCTNTGRIRGLVCRRCNGKGRYYVDNYTGEQVRADTHSGLADEIRHLLELEPAREYSCDRCGGDGAHGNGHRCTRCSGRGKTYAKPFRLHTTPEGTVPGSQLLDALQREDDHRDLPVWQELEHAMAVLRAHDPHAHTLIVHVYILGSRPATDLPVGDTIRLLHGMVFLEATIPHFKLPGELRSAHAHQQAALARAKGCKAAPQARRARDLEIRRLRGTGAWTQTQLAKRFDLSQKQVSVILTKLAV